MGFFNETEEEKQYKSLIKTIRYSSNLTYEMIEFLVGYIEDVKNKRINNDFWEFDFLEKVMLGINASTFDSLTDLKDFFNTLILKVKFFLPQGLETPEYEPIKGMLINYFVSKEGLIGSGLFQERMYALFDSRIDYLFIMNIIAKDKKLITLFDDICNYICEVAPYCINQTILKNEIISCLNGIDGVVGDLSDYFNKRILDAKKRVGIYDLDEKTLALISAEAEKAQGLIEKLNSMQKKIDNYTEAVATLTKNGRKDLNDLVKSGKKEIGSCAVETIKEMQNTVNEQKQEIIRQLDEYLATLEETLKQNSDKVFNKVLLEAQEKINNVKLAAQKLSNATTTELLKIQEASEASVNKLRNYVENEPKLQEYLKSASDDEKIREALLQFSSLQTGAETQAIIATPTSGIMIPATDRLVVPANPNVIIPKTEVKTGILSAFDETIPFEVRMKRILDEKKRREAEGEIFHEITEEAIACILEGDWLYLWGPSGCGKSYTMSQLASLIGIDYIDNGKITDKFSIMAYNDPHGRFRATQTYIATLYGKLLAFDEFDNGNTDTQVILNTLYSSLLKVLENPNKPEYITFAEDMVVPINPNFRMISAGNTSGEGENQIFSSRGKIDESVQERMTPKKVNYDNRVEERIFGDYRNWYEFFVNFRRACDEYAKKEGLDTAPGIGTTRDAAAIVKYIGHNSKTVDQVLREKFVQTKPQDYLEFLVKMMKKYYEFERITDVDFNGDLREVPELVLAKKFTYRCKQAIEKGER